MGLCLISSKEISEYRRRWNAMLVDLRNPKAYRQWHIPEAQNVPLEELELFMEQVPKSRLVIFYCQYCNTSIQEGCRYVKRGYRICSVAGGIDAYRACELQLYKGKVLHEEKSYIDSINKKRL